MQHKNCLRIDIDQVIAACLLKRRAVIALLSSSAKIPTIHFSPARENWLFRHHV